MKKRENPFEGLISQIGDLITFIDEKGSKIPEEGISDDKFREIQALEVVARYYMDFIDDFLKKSGQQEKILPGKPRPVRKQGPRERRFFEQLDHLKRELLARRRVVRAAFDVEKEKAVPPKKAKKVKEAKKKVKKKKHIKKFRDIGGKEGWIPL